MIFAIHIFLGTQNGVTEGIGVVKKSFENHFRQKHIEVCTPKFETLQALLSYWMELYLDEILWLEEGDKYISTPNTYCRVASTNVRY